MDSLDLTDQTSTRATDLAGGGAQAARCRAVLIEFLNAIDHGRASEALGLFTDDASLLARGELLHGQDAIQAFLIKREAETDRQTVHVITNEKSEGILELRATLILYVRERGREYVIERLLDSTQIFRRTAAGWRISHREVSPVHDEQS